MSNLCNKSSWWSEWASNHPTYALNFNIAGSLVAGWLVGYLLGCFFPLILSFSFVCLFFILFQIYIVWIENKRHILFTIHMVDWKKNDKRHEKTHIQLRHKCDIHKSKRKHSRNEVIIFVFNTLFMNVCWFHRRRCRHRHRRLLVSLPSFGR